MKRNSRASIRDKVAKQIEEMKEPKPIPKDVRTGREQMQSILAPEIVTLPTKEEPEPKPQIVLYLREGVNPAEKNFTKYPNDMHSLMTDRLTEYESLLYVKLWRESWGYGKNYCRIGYSVLLNETSLRSKSTVTRAVAGLREKRFIILALDDSNHPKTTQAGSIYRVLTPFEILDDKTEEGIVLESILTTGVLCVSILKEDTHGNPHEHNNDKGVVTKSIASVGIPTENSSQTDYTGIPTESIVTENTPVESDRHSIGGCIQTEYTQGEYTFKEDSLKDSLSEDPVKLFYTGIGQKRVSKVRREKGESILQDLQKEGFSPEEIRFAVEWTLKPGNTKEKVHDFSIVSHTIGQALSAKEAGQQAADAARKEEAGFRAAEEERKRLEGEIEDLRSKLSEAELADLRKQAEAEIAKTDGIKKEFINEPLIVAKENEILRRNNQLKGNA